LTQWLFVRRSKWMKQMSFLISESLSDTIITYMVLKRLTKPFEEWDAYKLGIIDAEGKKIKTPTSSKEKEAWTSLDVMVWNMKKLLGKYINKSTLARYFTAAMLISENIRPYMNYKLITENKTYPELNDFDCDKQLILFQIIKRVQLNRINMNEDDTVIYEIMLKEKTIDVFLNEHETEFLRKIVGE